MEIYGNPQYSDKFFVYLEDGSIKWVKSLVAAKNYVSNVRFGDWYNKPIYCTNEDIITAYNGKLYLKSECPEDPNTIKTYDNKSLFITQVKKHIDIILNELAQNLGSESFYTLISWKDSSIKDLNDIANKVLSYRDEIYKYFLKILNKHSEKLNITNELLDLSYIYDEFIEGMPKFEG